MQSSFAVENRQNSKEKGNNIAMEYGHHFDPEENNSSLTFSQGLMAVAMAPLTPVFGLVAVFKELKEDRERELRWAEDTGTSIVHKQLQKSLDTPRTVEWCDHVLWNTIHMDHDIGTPEKLRDAIEKKLVQSCSNEELAKSSGLLDKEVNEVFEYAQSIPRKQFDKVFSGIWSEERIAKDIEYCEDLMEHKEQDVIHNELMDNWEELNQVVGGDLFDNTEKLEVMRRVDRSRSSEGVSIPSAQEINDDWGDFQSAVVAEFMRVGLIGNSNVNVEPDNIPKAKPNDIEPGNSPKAKSEDGDEGMEITIFDSYYKNDNDLGFER